MIELVIYLAIGLVLSHFIDQERHWEPPTVTLFIVAWPIGVILVGITAGLKRLGWGD